MPKCLDQACENQVAGALYCDNHKYKSGSTTNIRQDRSEPDSSYVIQRQQEGDRRSDKTDRPTVRDFEA